MKALKTSIIACAALLSLGSCDFLDKEPTLITSDNYFKSEAEAESYLRSVFAIITQPTFYGNQYFYLAGGDDLTAYGGSGRQPSNGGLICNNATTGDPYVAGLWYTLYAGVNRANTLLEKLPNISGMSESSKALFTAQARFLRAFYYFNLVQCWGDVPFRTESTKQPEGNQIARTPKAQIYDFICKEMKEAAEDLPKASTLSYQPGSLSKSAAWGILARVYMFRAGEYHRDNKTANEEEVKSYFTEANKYLELVQGEGHSLATKYWNYFIDQCSGNYNTTAPESIWEAEFTGTYSSDIVSEGRTGNTIGIQCPDLSSKTQFVGKTDPGYGYSFFWSTPKLYELYEAQENATETGKGDIDRMNWNIAPFTYTQSVTGDKTKGVDGRLFEVGKLEEVQNQYWDLSYEYGLTDPTKKIGDREKTKASTDYDRSCAKWRREYESKGLKKNKNFTAINFPILRYADVLLMRAECENEVNNGPTIEAYNCINEVRRRAGLKPIPAGLDHDQFLAKIKDERAMELCFEMTRRWDLIRWGDFVKNMNALAPRAKSGLNWKLGPSNVYTYFQVSDAYNYFPIPSSEMNVNKLIPTNNPGW